MAAGQEGVVVIQPGEGKTLPGIVFKISDQHTGNLFSIVEHPYGPKVLIPPHVHANHDQVTYVLEGPVGIRIGEREIDASTGTYVRKPRGIPHTHWNPRTDPARVMEITFPGGFEGFFEEMGRAVAAGATPERLGIVGARYATTFIMDWVPELVRKYGLKLMGR